MDAQRLPKMVPYPDSLLDDVSQRGLDAHTCPNCHWSFTERIPRELDCGHSFFFCENCLRRRKAVKCSTCRRVTPITQELFSPFGKSTASRTKALPSVGDPMAEVKYLRTEISRLRTELSDGRLSVRSVECESPTDSFSALRGDVLRSKERCQQLTSETHELREQLSTSSRRVSDLRNESEVWKEKYSRENEITVELTAEKNELQSLVLSLKQALAAVRHSQDGDSQVRGERRTQRREVETLQRELEAAHSQMAIDRERIEDLQKDKRQPLASGHSVSGPLSAMRTRVNDCTKELACLRADIGTAVHKMSEDFSQKTDSLSQIVLQFDSELKRARLDLFQECSLRRKYFNLVQELRGNIRVLCRVRPLLGFELARECYSVVHVRDSGSVQFTTVDECSKKAMARDKKYEFEKVFAPNCTQSQVFDGVRELAISVMDGYNVCIFAYGQTGSGKTHTMEGGTDAGVGVNLRSVTELFAEAKRRKAHWRFSITLSMLEIYNEKIRDLLVDKSEALERAQRSSRDLADHLKVEYLRLRTDANGGCFVEGLRTVVCDSADCVLRALATGSKNRCVGVTNLNEHSSRSHQVLTVYVEGVCERTDEVLRSKLHLVDLAGSERTDRSQATGARLKEANCINSSLSCLGKVLAAIRKKTAHVPFRDCVLTRLLEDSLSAQSKVLMFVNVSPNAEDSEETYSSLQFASRVRDTRVGVATRNVYESTKGPTTASRVTDSSSDVVSGSRPSAARMRRGRRQTAPSEAYVMEARRLEM